MLPQNIFRLLVYFAVAAYLSSANADPAQESKAEAALGRQDKVRKFSKKSRWYLDQWSQCENRQQSLFQPHF
jgi:hypothetical protein